MEKRTMSIARGLTRLKTIDAQISSANLTVQAGGAVSSLALTKLSNKKDLVGNHREAQEEVRSALQKIKDLIAEAEAIRLAIAKANLETKIVINGRSMSIAEALIVRSRTSEYYADVVSAFDLSASQAESLVSSTNNRIPKEATAEQVKVLTAMVQYLVPLDKMKSIREFITEFEAEVDGTLNEINAVTMIEI